MQHTSALALSLLLVGGPAVCGFQPAWWPQRPTVTGATAAATAARAVGRPRLATPLGSARSSEDNEAGQQQQQEQPYTGHLTVYGLTATKLGFCALVLDKDSQMLLPVRVDTVPSRASSPEALTLCQLFQGIDMAGTIFPPDMMAVRCLQHLNAPIEYDGKEYPFATASEWLRARAPRPKVTLQQLVIGMDSTWSMMAPTEDDLTFAMECTCELDVGGTPETRELTVPLTGFQLVALAMRFPNPRALMPPFLVADSSLMEHDDNPLSRPLAVPLDQLEKFFPDWFSQEDAARQSARVTSNLSKAYEETKLQSALRIAQQKGDNGAVEKILAAMRKLENESARDALEDCV